MNDLQDNIRRIVEAIPQPPRLTSTLSLHGIDYQISRAPEAIYIVSMRTGMQSHVVAKVVRLERLIPFLQLHAQIEREFRDFQRVQLLGEK